MAPHRLDALARALAQGRTRRTTLALGGSLLAAPLVSRLPGDAKKKTKKITLCLNGRTIRTTRKKRKKLLEIGATPGACSPSGCVAACEGKTCGGDGCGGSCGVCGPCQACQDGRCAPTASDASCGGGCRECQGGQCVAKPNGTACPEADVGRCRAGICNPIPPCMTFGNDCISGRECCYQQPGDVCPVPPRCQERVGAGRRCRFDADCISNVCLGYVCE